MSILAAVIISLAVNWLLALLIIGFLPFLMVPGFIQWAILSAYTSHYKRGTDEAEKVGLGSVMLPIVSAQVYDYTSPIH